MLVDSSIIIEFFKGNEKVVDIFLKADNIYISIFDYGLLIAGIYNTEKINHNLYILKGLIRENLKLLNFEIKEAELYAKLKLEYCNIDDILLMNIAIAKINNLTFFTLNTKYQSIKGLKTLLLN